MCYTLISIIFQFYFATNWIKTSCTWILTLPLSQLFYSRLKNYLQVSLSHMKNSRWSVKTGVTINTWIRADLQVAVLLKRVAISFCLFLQAVHFRSRLDHKNTYCWQCHCQLPSTDLLWLNFGNHRCTGADQKPHSQVSPGSSIQSYANPNPPLSANPDLGHFLLHSPKDGNWGQLFEYISLTFYSYMCMPSWVHFP